MLLAAVMAAAGLVATGMSPALAEECDGAWVETPPGSGIVICVDTPAEPGGEDAGHGGDDGGGGSSKCYNGDKEVPCTDEYGGIWDAGHSCYAFQLDPQPPAESPMWEGHDPSEGSVWSCDHTVSVLMNTWFVANGEQPVVDPAVLAQQALDTMQLELADAKIAPGPAFHTYVNIDNWMWVPAEQWHGLSLTVSAGATSVTATAAPVRVEWDMGAETVSCFDAGREWKKGMTDAAQTTCDYAYESIENPTGDTHDVSAQIVYLVTWTCSGTCLRPAGDLGEVTAPSDETTTIEVRQRQTVVTN